MPNLTRYHSSRIYEKFPNHFLLCLCIHVFILPFVMGFEESGLSISVIFSQKATFPTKVARVPLKKKKKKKKNLKTLKEEIKLHFCSDAPKG